MYFPRTVFSVLLDHKPYIAGAVQWGSSGELVSENAMPHCVGIKLSYSGRVSLNPSLYMQQKDVGMRW